MTGNDYDHRHGGHGHVHAPANFGKAFALGVALNAVFAIIEVVYGLASNSVSLLADAGHNLSDALGLGVAWAAVIRHGNYSNSLITSPLDQRPTFVDGNWRTPALTSIC